MDDGDFTSNSILGTSPDADMDIDFMEELFLGGCWVETTDQYNILQSSPSTSGALNAPVNYLPPLETNTSHLVSDPNQRCHLPENPISVHPQTEEVGTESQRWKTVQTLTSSGQLESFLVEGNELSTTWWIDPSPRVDSSSSSSSSVKDRLILAIKHLRDSTKDRNVLIQIWVPVRREGKNVLTTTDQPYSLDPNCKSLEFYRNVSEHYQFPAEEDSKESIGLPGRVYLGKVPEWTPDVRLFKSTEYPRIDYAQQYNVKGSIALPVFERGSGTCLGVVEIVWTSQKINYRPELENVCKALEAVDLRSSESFSPSHIKACNESYQAALPEIIEVLTSVCETLKLPLAQTWAHCWNSNSNSVCCISTIDSAFYAADPKYLGFHEECSDHNLFGGQGIVGRAFTTNEPCFASDVTAYTKTEYPLSHHARMCGLCAAVAVRLRSVHTGSAEFVLEFFLPTDCQSIEEQKQMLRSFSFALQRSGRSLRDLTGKELKEDVLLPVKDAVVASGGRPTKEGTPETKSSPSNDSPEKDSSWISYMMEAQKEERHEEFKVTTHWDDSEKESHHCQVFQDLETLQQDSGAKGIIESGGDSSSLSGRHSGGRKGGEKRRTKTEKTISLPVLRQYFAGSLKDAAKSIGVCPTTLKRICRQHGITRWPSRKIKKVGHSLRKLQLVIDSVQGAEGALQIGNFYSNYPELSSPNISGPIPFSSLKMPDQLEQPNLQQEEGALLSLGGTTSKSPSSSCSQSSTSSLCFSTGANEQPSMVDAMHSRDDFLAEDLGGSLKRVRSDAELHVTKLEETKLLARSHSHKSLGQHPSLAILPPIPKHSNKATKDGNAFRVKATFGEEKVRFSLQHNWVFRDIHQEISRRFNLDDTRKMDLKYLDDDSEWVLLTCDADLEECIDIYKSCQRHTIKLSVHLASHPNLGNSFGRSGLS